MSLKDDQDDITEDAIAVSAVQPDKIAQDCDAEATSELSPKAPGSNHWLWHPSLEEARVGLSRCMEQMRQNQTWTRELEQTWTRLHDIQEAKPALAEALQLNEQRRQAYANANGLHDDECRLETVSYTHLTLPTNREV